jgi:hypothetical protein
MEIRIEVEVDGHLVNAFRSHVVPGNNECINWENKYKVVVTSRDWVIDSDVNPLGVLS